MSDLINMPAQDDDYDRVAGIYDSCSYVYSLGQIQRSKRLHNHYIRSGNRVLYAGGGSGEEAVASAGKGVRVTLVDRSKKMTEKAIRRFERAGLTAGIEIICEDIMAHHRPGYYDAIAAHYFLNVFEPAAMERVLEHLATQLKPGGFLFIADFSPLQGGPLSRLLQWMYYMFAIQGCRLLAGNCVHPVYDYRAGLYEVGLELVQESPCRFFSVGPAWYWTLVARKRG